MSGRTRGCGILTMLLVRLGRAAATQEVVGHHRQARSRHVLDLRPPVHQRCTGAVHEDSNVTRAVVDQSTGAVVDSEDPPRSHLHTLSGQRRLRLLDAHATWCMAVYCE